MDIYLSLPRLSGASALSFTVSPEECCVPLIAPLTWWGEAGVVPQPQIGRAVLIQTKSKKANAARKDPMVLALLWRISYVAHTTQNAFYLIQVPEQPSTMVRKAMASIRPVAGKKTPL